MALSSLDPPYGQRWDPFPFPVEGDVDERHTFEWSGRITEQWESVEFQLSRVYSAFVGAVDGPSIREYGTKGRIFRDRLVGLCGVAEAYFMRLPDQHLEGTFDALAREAEGFADRRNEVAHSLLVQLTDITFLRQFLKSPTIHQFALVPALYQIRKHDARGLPQFAYTSTNMKLLWARLFDLSERIGTFREILVGGPSPEPA